MPSRPHVLVATSLALALGACAASPPPARRPAAQSAPPAADAAVAVAMTPTPRVASHGDAAAHLPDGAPDPEACVGACSLVRPGDDDAGATGTIDLAEVDRALRRDARTLRGCYDLAVRDHPALASQGGTVTVRFVVGEEGRVRGVPVATGIDDVPQVARCLSSRLRYVAFPRPVGGPAEVTLPFTFAAEG